MMCRDGCVLYCLVQMNRDNSHGQKCVSLNNGLYLTVPFPSPFLSLSLGFPFPSHWRPLPSNHPSAPPLLSPLPSPPCCTLYPTNSIFRFTMRSTTSQPIALPSTQHNTDYSMASGSYTGSNGDFNPASYTRHFLGSPLSWRPGSFGGRFYPSGSPSAQLLTSLESVLPFSPYPLTH